MFGYFRPYDAVYSWDSRHAFVSHYCRLCYCMRGVGGQAARALTTFDVALYSMILNISTGGTPPALFDCQKIKMDNVRYFSTDKVAMKLAHLSFIAVGGKIEDDLLDGNKFRAGSMNLLFKKAIKTSREAEPSLAKILDDNLAKLNELEKSENCTTEMLLDCYGNGMVEVFMDFAELPEGAKKLYNSIARWTYFVDMLTDYEEDYRTNAPNTLIEKDCPTLDLLWEKKYRYIMDLNKSISDDILDGLEMIKVDKQEWKTLKEILVYALDNVVSGVFSGKDVTFHYFKEYGRNVQNVHEQHRKVKRRYKKQK